MRLVLAKLLWAFDLEWEGEPWDWECQKTCVLFKRALRVRVCRREGVQGRRKGVEHWVGGIGAIERDERTNEWGTTEARKLVGNGRQVGRQAGWDMAGQGLDIKFVPG